MKFDVYTRADGCYVVLAGGSPNLVAVEAMHGPLDFCESIAPEDYPFPNIWTRVNSELDRHAHALLEPAIGRRLMGLDCDDDVVGEHLQAPAAR